MTNHIHCKIRVNLIVNRNYLNSSLNFIWFAAISIAKYIAITNWKRHAVCNVALLIHASLTNKDVIGGNNSKLNLSYEDQPNNCFSRFMNEFSKQLRSYDLKC